MLARDRRDKMTAYFVAKAHAANSECCGKRASAHSRSKVGRWKIRDELKTQVKYVSTSSF